MGVISVNVPTEKSKFQIGWILMDLIMNYKKHLKIV